MAAKLAGQGGGKYDVGANSDINVTPFVDILLVLLIVFMVSVPMATVAIKVDLPPAPINPPPQKKEPVYLSIREDGLYLRANLTELPRLASDLEVALAEGETLAPREQTVLIRADRGVKYSRFMEVVNQLQYDGFYKIGLISEELG